MALEIGGGIHIGGGISVQIEQPVVLLPNTMTVANDGGNYYGADPMGYSGGPAGMMNNEMIRSLLVYWYDYSSPGYATLRLIPGTYSNCMVSINGSLDGDLHSYPRTFVINSTSYTFVFNEMTGSYICNSSLGFPNLVGETIGVAWDGNTPVVPTGSILVSTFEGYGTTSYGANNGYNPARNMQIGPMFGTVNNPAFNSIAYSLGAMGGGTTFITLHNYDYGSFTVNDGLIYGDTTSQQVFTINNKRYSFSPVSGFNAGYMRDSDVGLMTAGLGSAVSIYYDAENQGGNGHTASGTLVSGTNNTTLFGVVPGMMGSMNVIPNMLFTINYDNMQNVTTVVFKTGTYYGGIVVDDTLATIDGQTDVTVTVYGTSKTGTLVSSGGMGPSFSFSGDAFNLMGKQGVELPVTIDAVAPSNSVTYTASVDYSPGAQFPPGVYLVGQGPTYTMYLSESFWFTSAGFTAIHNLSMNGTFDVTMPTTGSTVYTITLVGAWQGPGPDFWVDVSSSSPLTLPGGSDNCPSTVIVSTGSSSGSSSITGMLKAYNDGMSSTYGSYSAVPGESPMYGDISSTPTIVFGISYNGDFGLTRISLYQGSIGGFTVTGTSINGHTAITFTYNSVTATTTYPPADVGGSWLQFRFDGDPFNMSTTGANLTQAFTITLA